MDQKPNREERILAVWRTWKSARDERKQPPVSEEVGSRSLGIGRVNDTTRVSEERQEGWRETRIRSPNREERIQAVQQAWKSARDAGHSVPYVFWNAARREDKTLVVAVRVAVTVSGYDTEARQEGVKTRPNLRNVRGGQSETAKATVCDFNPKTLFEPVL